jgi:general secretion pathway protein L
VENDLTRNAMPYATALAGACPHLAPSANVLPQEYRKSSSRMLYVPTIVLASLLALVAVAMAVYSNYADRQYLKRIRAEMTQLAPRKERASNLDKAYSDARARTQMLDAIRRRTRDDMDALNELTRLLEPPTWTANIELGRDAVRIGGESPQATSLVKILDSSPLFKNTALKVSNGQSFQIETTRRVAP